VACRVPPPRRDKAVLQNIKPTIWVMAFARGSSSEPERIMASAGLARQ
jgi:hypothetical protein